MKIEKYKKYHQEIFKTQLEDGLHVSLAPKKGFNSIYASLTVKAGAADQEILSKNGERIFFPAGTAHFVEHQMFEKKDYDPDLIFNDLGAYSNAFTTQSQTVYYFESSDPSFSSFEKSLELLLKMVQEEYFDKKAIEKERQIITQELSMYRDSPDWNLSNGLLKNLYPEQPLAFDIGGSASSIGSIDSDTLSAFHDYFYQPENLYLKITGGFDANEALSLTDKIQSNIQKKSPLAFKRIDRFKKIPVLKEDSINFPLEIPLNAVGIRTFLMPDDRLAASYLSLAVDLLLDTYFSESSTWFLENYSNGLIDDDFYLQFEMGREYAYIGFYNHFQKNGFEKSVYDRLFSMKIDDTNRKIFDLQKKARFGSDLMSLDSLENNLVSAIDAFDPNQTTLETLGLIKTLDLDQALALFKKYFSLDSFSSFSVLPS